MNSSLSSTLLVAAIFLARPANAETITVCLDGTCDYSDIQAAIDASVSGTTILIGPGTYTIAKPIVAPDHAIELVGPDNAEGSAPCVITSNHLSRILEVDAGPGASLVLRNITLAGGEGTPYSQPCFNHVEYNVGGAMYVGNSANVAAYSCIIKDCHANWGGAIEVESATLSLEDCLLADNSAAYGGVAYLECGAMVNFRRCALSGNTASVAYGLFGGDQSSTVTMADCVSCENAPQTFSSSLYVDDAGGNCMHSTCMDRDQDGWPECIAGDDFELHVPDEYETIQMAIEFAAEPAVIHVAAGTYMIDEPIDTLGRAVEIRGETDDAGNPLTILDGSGSSQLVRCTSDEGPATIFRNLVFRNGSGYTGGGVHMYYAGPTIENCWFEACSATNGGGIYFYDRWGTTLQSALIKRCRFIGNSAVDGGGLCIDGNSATVIQLEDCVFDENQASGRGGGIFDDFCDGNSNAGLRILNCEIRSNTALIGGGLYKATWCSDGIQSTNTIYCGNSPDQIFIDGSDFPSGTNCIAFACDDNDLDGLPDKCGGSGGTVRLVPEEFATIQDAVNASGTGDEIRISPGVYSASDGEVLIQPGGKALRFVGASGTEETILDGDGVSQIVRITAGEAEDTEFINLTFRNGRGVNGGAVYSAEGIPYFENCRFHNNIAEADGGAVFAADGSGLFVDCEFRHNSAGSSGGAIYHYDYRDIILQRCLVSENTAPLGGGVYSAWAYGRIILDESLVCANSKDQIYGNWALSGLSCVSVSCVDTDGDGLPDKCGNPGGNVHHVPSDFATIQDAINAASHGDEILVAPGTYTGTGAWVCNPLGKRIIVRSEGGPGVTFIDGESERRCILAAGNETAATAFIGFTIQNGMSTDGGGAYCNFNSMGFVDCRFVGNHASQYGGAIGGVLWTGTMDQCLLEGNTAGNRGGAAWLRRTSPDIRDTVFTNNTAQSGGGAIYFSNVLRDAVISDCVFIQNAAERGGAIFDTATNACTVSFEACAFASNTAKIGGTEDGHSYGWSAFRFADCIFNRCCTMTPVLECDYSLNNDFAGFPFLACNSCRANVDCRDDVNAQDLGLLLSAWGSSSAQFDLDGDGTVRAGDLGLLLTAWGACAPNP